MQRKDAWDKGSVMAKKPTTEEWVAKADAIHKGKYDYSKVEYVNAHTNVTIICPIHGEFEQKPYVHANLKCGCQKCWSENRSKSKRKTLEEFIKEAREKHGYYYDYSKVNYVNTDTKVIIICPVHGEFRQTPSNHLKCGCKKCGALKTAQKLRFSQEYYVAAVAKVNPNIEILGKIINSSEPVLCRCKVCGHKWRPAINNILRRGYGCAQCAGNAKLSHEEQVAAIYKVNPNIEILGKIEGNDKPVLCRCLICGHKWNGRPSSLKRKSGCSKCANYGFLAHDQGNLYIMVDDLEVPTIMKVGVSVSPEERKDQVIRSAKKAGAVFSDLHVIKTWEGTTDDMHALEKAMHKALSQYKINFSVKFDGCQEFFHYRPGVFGLIEEHLKKLTTEE